MAIVTLGDNDSGSTSRTVINDNFSDLDTTKADLASPTFTGTPTLPTGTIGVTQAANDNSTKLATTAYVDGRVTANFSTTQVFSGAAPSTFTDLDLSAVVGASQRMVMLAVTCNTGGGYYYAFRTNGTTLVNTADGTIDGGTANFLISGTGLTGYVIVKTDTAGVIEWDTSGTPTTVISVQAYW